MQRFSLLRLVRFFFAALCLLSATAASAGAPDIEVVEFYHPETRHYFMTGSKGEQFGLDSVPALFKRTGRSFGAWSGTTSRPAEAVPVMRFFNPSLVTHVFTANQDDIVALRALSVSKVATGFIDEGIAFYLLKANSNTCATGQKAIFRAYNNRPDGNHRYSNDLPTQAATVKSGFVHEGVAFCSPNATSNAAIEKTAGTPRDIGEDLTVSGVVSGFTSGIDFMVGTQKVNAGSARFDRAAASALANGVSVRIEGVIIGGVLMATEVKFFNMPSGVVDEFKGFITALGSQNKIFVNGSEVDISTARVSGGFLQSLVIGTEVELHGNFVDSVFVATHLHIEGVSSLPDISGAGLAEVQGKIVGYLSVANFTVSGQKIDATNAVFDDGTVNNLADGSLVEVKGKIVAGVLIATRVEFKTGNTSAPPSVFTPDLVEFETKGIVSDFVSVSQFTLGGKTINAAAAVFLRGTPADLRNGSIVEVKGTLVGGNILASRVKFDDDFVTLPPGSTPPIAIEFEAKDTVSSFISVASFILAGTMIDASNATFRDGAASDLENGVIVEVKGIMVGNTVIATRVSFEDAPDAIEFEATGLVSAFVSVSSFVVGGQTIDASGASIERGTVADLRNGVLVEVKGDLVDGIVRASRLRFER